MEKKLLTIYKYVPGTVTLGDLEELLSLLQVQAVGIDYPLKIIFKVATLNKDLYSISTFYSFNPKTKENNIDFNYILLNYLDIIEGYYLEVQAVVLSVINIKESFVTNPPKKEKINLSPTYKEKSQQYLESIVPVYDKDLNLIVIDNTYFFEKNRTTRVDFIDANKGVKSYKLFDTNNNTHLVLYEEFKDSYIVRRFQNNKIEFYVSLVDTSNYFFVKSYNTQKITKKPQNVRKSNKFLTVDIETYKLPEGTYVPYAIGYYDGEKLKTLYLTDFKNPESMIYNLFKQLFKTKYNNYTIYFHNLSNFDAYFIINTLRSKFSHNIIIKENKGKLISFKIIYKNKYSINIYDSYRLLPLSLSKLGESFNVEVKKSVFPYSFVNKNNLLYYGEKPDFTYYNNISINEYNNIPISNWSLRLETIKYLSNDLISLYLILKQFNDYIFNHYGLNITKSPTLPSLALALYRSKYYKNNVPIIQGKKYLEIKQSYFGGRCEIFKPSNIRSSPIKIEHLPSWLTSSLDPTTENISEDIKIGDPLFYYDVNSLYPFVMKNAMPVGEVKSTNNPNLQDIFGFCYAKIETPEDMYYPILPTKINGKLLFPLGKFEGWYFSEELKYAKEQGYKIELIKSYIFDKNFIFDKYVNDFYAIKSSKDLGKKTIGKLFLNSLYGKFAQDIKFTEAKIIDKKDLNSFILNNNLLDIEILDKNQVLVYYSTLPESLNSANIEDTYNIAPNISISISSAIASYARIFMHKIFTRLQQLGVNVYYTDTDSIVVDRPLPEDLVGYGIGEFKLVFGNIKEAYFPLPKIYGFKLQNDSEIIKFKGINSNKTNLDQIISLLNSISIDIQDTREFKNYIYSTYTEKNVTLTIQGSHSYNKRERILIDDLWVDTKPFKI